SAVTAREATTAPPGPARTIRPARSSEGVAGRGGSQLEGVAMNSTTADATRLTEHESEQVDRANASGRKPVVFIHGLWLLPSSWDRWAALFEDAGYTTLTPGWPDDPRPCRTQTLTPRGSPTRR